MEKRYFLLILILLCFFHTINNIIIVAKDNAPLIFDQQGHYRTAYHISQALKSDMPLDLKITEILRLKAYYPFLGYAITALLFLFFGASVEIAIYSYLFYFYLLIFFTYKLGEIIKDKITGLWASILVSFFPTIFGFSRVYMLDFPITALLTLGIYLMLKSNYFENKKYTFFFALTLAAALLHKQTYLIYISAPIILYLIYSIKKNKILALKNFILIILSTLFTIPWYYSSYQNQITLIKMSLHLPQLDLAKVSILFYQNFYRYHLHPILTIIFYPCLLLFILSKVKHKSIILSWLMMPFLYIMLFYYETLPRHTLAILPAISIIISFSLRNILTLINIKTLRYFIYSILMIFLFSQFFLLCYPKKRGKITDRSLELRYHWQGMLTYQTFDYSFFDYILNEVLQKMRLKEEKLLYIGYLHPSAFTEILSFYFLKAGLPNEKIELFYALDVVADEIKFNPFFFDLIICEAPLTDLLQTLSQLKKYDELQYHYFIQQFRMILEAKSKAKAQLLSRHIAQVDQALRSFMEKVKDNANYYRLIYYLKLPHEIYLESYPRQYYIYCRKD